MRRLMSLLKLRRKIDWGGDSGLNSGVTIIIIRDLPRTHPASLSLPLPLVIRIRIRPQSTIASKSPNNVFASHPLQHPQAAQTTTTEKSNHGVRSSKHIRLNINSPLISSLAPPPPRVLGPGRNLLVGRGILLSAPARVETGRRARRRRGSSHSL